MQEIKSSLKAYGIHLLGLTVATGSVPDDESTIGIVPMHGISTVVHNASIVAHDLTIIFACLGVFIRIVFDAVRFIMWARNKYKSGAELP